MSLCPFLIPLPSAHVVLGWPTGHRGAQGIPLGGGVRSPISQGMVMGSREGDSKAGNGCLLLPKDE